MTALSVHADLTVERGDDTFSITGDGDHVVVDAPSLAAVARLRPVATRLVARVSDLPTSRVGDADLTVDVRVRGVRVARLAGDASPGVLSSLLGVTPAQVHLGGVVRAALRALR